jgi:hypothetical protein
MADIREARAELWRERGLVLVWYWRSGAEESFWRSWRHRYGPKDVKPDFEAEVVRSVQFAAACDTALGALPFVGSAEAWLESASQALRSLYPADLRYPQYGFSQRMQDLLIGRGKDDQDAGWDEVGHYGYIDFIDPDPPHEAHDTEIDIGPEDVGHYEPGYDFAHGANSSASAYVAERIDDYWNDEPEPELSVVPLSGPGEPLLARGHPLTFIGFASDQDLWAIHPRLQGLSALEFNSAYRAITRLPIEYFDVGGYRRWRQELPDHGLVRAAFMLESTLRND